MGGGWEVVEDVERAWEGRGLHCSTDWLGRLAVEGWETRKVTVWRRRAVMRDQRVAEERREETGGQAHPGY